MALELYLANETILSFSATLSQRESSVDLS